MQKIPVIDISAVYGDKEEAIENVAKEIDSACRNVGFLVISGHGVQEKLTDSVLEFSRQFFDLPLERKMLVVRPSVDILRGYIPFRSETLTNSLGDQNKYGDKGGDLNESFMMGPPAVPADDAYYHGPEAHNLFIANIWPEYPDHFRDALERYYAEMSRLGATIMELFARALGLSKDFFVAKIDKTVSRLRIRNYPAVKHVPEQVRAGAHRDYGSLTILKADTEIGGLQVDLDGRWIDVPIIPDTFVVNIGELMERWTNNAWKATLHRVTTPDRDKISRRMSIVFFHNPNYDADISCIPTCVRSGETAAYPPTTSGEYLRSQFLKTQTGR